MFSEYASRYLSKSQRPVPLFNRQSTGNSDVDDYLEAMSGSSEDGSDSSGSESSSLHSESESDSPDQPDQGPPSDLLVERPHPHKKRAPKHKTGYSLWKHNIEAWTKRQPPLPGDSAVPTPTAGPSRPGARADNAQQPRWHQPTPSRTVTTDASAHPGDLERGTPRGKALDITVAAIYLVSMAFSLTTAFLVALTAPQNGGAVYPIFVYSARSLVAYAVLATVVSAGWLYIMRYFTKAVVQISIFAVPAVLISTSVISIFLSVHQSVGWHGLAHAAMRVSALAPLAVALLWVLYLRRVKDVTGRAADIVVLSAVVYNECTPMMTLLTLVSGVTSLTVTGFWSFFLARAFLDGRLGVILGAWFTFMYLWTWGLLCAILRAVLANVTTEWYMENPMTDVLGRSIYEAMTYHFSSACFSALVALLIRAPLLLLPTRLGSVLQRFAAATLSASTSRILSPLTLPTAVINRSSLNTAAQAISSPEFAAIDRRPYRLAKLFLVSARVCCSLVIGFIAWIHADRVQDVSSAYGYLVAVIALFIGWTVMGASENMLSMISDALLVNYVVNDSSPKRESLRHLFQNTLHEAPVHNGAASILESDGSDSS